MTLATTIGARRKHISWALMVFLSLCFVAGSWQMLRLYENIQLAMEEIRSTQQDNRTWVVAQAETDLLAYRLALDRITHEPSEQELKLLQKRFDIFYSRVETVRTIIVYTPELNADGLVEDWAEIVRMTHEDAAIFDAGAASVLAHVEDLAARAADAAPKVRGFVVDALQRLIVGSTSLREQTLSLLDNFFVWTVVMIGILVALALGVLLSLYWITRYVRLKAHVSARQTKVINAAIDAVLICDESGRLLEHNAAADQLFGFGQDPASLPRLDQLFMPGQPGSWDRPGSGASSPSTSWHSLATKPTAVLSEIRRCDGIFVPVECVFTVHSEMDGRSTFIVFVRDISKRLENEHRLEAARDAAERGEKAKSRFLAVMSHEMRTPINGLIAALDIVQKTTRLTQRQAKFLSIASQCGATTLEQIDDVLELTRLDGFSLPEEAQGFDLVSLLRTLVEQNRPMAAQRGNTIHLSLPEAGLPMVLGPRRTLSRVIINLLGNAIKFTQNGKIDVRLSCEEQDGAILHLCLSVKDTGTGIAPDRLDVIFKDFETDSGSGPLYSNGTGLGLGIVRRAMDRMGGSIQASSELGQGSTFVARFPLKALSGEPRPAAEAGVDGPADAARAVGLRNLSVLIAEDNEINRLVLTEMLHHLDAKVDQAVDGLEAVKKAAENRYDLILMDLAMPRLDGIEATKRLRQGGASAGTRVVGLTANAMAEQLERMRAAGMSTAISKPVTIDALRDILANADQSSRLQPAEVGGRLDRRTLEELALAMSPLGLRRLLDRFIAETDGAILQLNTNAASADLAHRMAGSAAMLGARELRMKLTGAENVLRRDGTAPDAMVEAIRTCWDLTRKELLDWQPRQGRDPKLSSPIP